MSKVIKETTCFAEHECRNLKCTKMTCDNWIDHAQSLNCVILASKTGAKTLHEIGNIFGLTRMRICQIEKNAIEIIKKKL